MNKHRVKYFNHQILTYQIQVYIYIHTYMYVCMYRTFLHMEI